MSENREEHCGRIGGPVYMRDGKPCPECGAIDTHEPSSSLRRRVAEAEEHHNFQLTLNRRIWRKLKATEDKVGEALEQLRNVSMVDPEETRREILVALMRLEEAKKIYDSPPEEES